MGIPKSSISMGFSLVNHLDVGTTILRETPIFFVRCFLELFHIIVGELLMCGMVVCVCHVGLVLEISFR